MDVRWMVFFAASLALTTGYVVLKDGVHIQLKDASGGLSIAASTSNRVAFDDRHNILYIVGKEPKRLTVYNVDAFDTATMLTEFVFDDPLDGYPLDVEVCNVPQGSGVSRLAITFEDPFSASAEGTVRIYETITPLDTTFNLLKTVTVGAGPVDMEFTQQCKILLVANQGRPTREGSTYRDPEGTVTKIVLPLDLTPSSIIDTVAITFGSALAGDFPTEDIDELRGMNFRVNPTRDPDGQLLTFMQNIEPERVVVDPSGEIAFVTLPKNNAIARLVLEFNQVSRIFPLGNRSWTNYHMDPSDRDNAVSLRSYNIRSVFQSTEMAWVSAKNEEWVITLDTGRHSDIAAYSYVDYQRAKELMNRNSIVTPDARLRSQLGNDTELGRLFISTEDGKDGSGNIRDVFTFGGRGFSVRDANNFQAPAVIVDSIEQSTDRYLSRVFNTAYTSNTNTPQTDREATSPGLGPELTAMSVGEFEGKTVLFMGGGSSGILYVYMLSPEAQCLQPYFQSIHRFGDQFATWQQAFTNGRMGDVGITDMLYISTTDVRPMLVVAGATSNSVSLYRVAEEPFTGADITS